MPFTHAVPKAKVYPRSYSEWNLGFYSRMIMDKFCPERKCNVCGRKERIEIHHKNHKWWDLRLSNMEYRCIFCHKKHHQPLMAKKLSATRKRLIAEGKIKIWNRDLDANHVYRRKMSELMTERQRKKYASRKIQA